MQKCVFPQKKLKFFNFLDLTGGIYYIIFDQTAIDGISAPFCSAVRPDIARARDLQHCECRVSARQTALAKGRSVATNAAGGSRNAGGRRS